MLLRLWAAFTLFFIPLCIFQFLKQTGIFQMAEPTASPEPHPQAALDTSVRAGPASAFGPRGQLGTEKAQVRTLWAQAGRTAGAQGTEAPEAAAPFSPSTWLLCVARPTEEGALASRYPNALRGRGSTTAGPGAHKAPAARGTTSPDRAEQHPSSAYRAGPLACTVWQTLSASHARADVLIFNRSLLLGAFCIICPVMLW